MLPMCLVVLMGASVPLPSLVLDHTSATPFLIRVENFVHSGSVFVLISVAEGACS